MPPLPHRQLLLPTLAVLLAATTVTAGCADRRSTARNDATANDASGAEAQAAPDAEMSAPAGDSVDADATTAPDAPAPPPAMPGYEVTASGDGLHITAPTGEISELWLGLAATTEKGTWAETPTSWTTTPDGWTTTRELANARWTFLAEADPARPVLVLRVVVDYLAPATIRHEELAVGVRGAGDLSVLGRDLAPRTVRAGESYLVDPWTPLEVHAGTAIGPLTLVRRAGFPSAVVENGAAGVVVRLKLDDAGNHPYRAYSRCYQRYSAANPRDELDGTPRMPGERVEHVAELWLGETHVLRGQRLPEGRRAAIVFTSHADQSKTATTRALLWGSSDAAAPEYGRRGMLGHGLPLTLGAFAESGTNADMTDPGFARVLDEAAAAGVEVCPHSVTSKPDSRETVARLLPRYAGYRPATWIDHQPDTNCEAVMNSTGLPGHDPAYRIANLLREAGIRYVWTEPDVEPPSRSWDMLGPRKPEYRPTILFRNRNYAEGEWTPWMFRTVWMFDATDVFVRSFAEEYVERLEEEHGILLVHAYMDTFQARGRLADRALVEPAGAGFGIKDAVDEVFRRLRAEQQRGRLWVPTMRDFGDHLTAGAEVVVSYAPDGTAVVTAGDLALRGITFAVDVPDAVPTVDGAPPAGIDSRDGQVVFWFDLPARESRTIRLTRDTEATPFISAGSTSLGE